MRMTRGGTSGQLVTMEIVSDDVFDSERNRVYSEKLIPHIAETFGIAKEGWVKKTVPSGMFI